MTVIFSSLFKKDLLDAETRYAAISSELSDDFHRRTREIVSAVIRWRGGDHVGPHGFQCRRCRPFPFLLYYHLEGDTLFILGLVHERRHPDYLRDKLEPGEKS
jgi:hypothetical protein